MSGWATRIGKYGVGTASNSTRFYREGQRSRYTKAKVSCLYDGLENLKPEMFANHTILGFNWQ
jgi:hypothetical protein